MKATMTTIEKIVITMIVGVLLIWIAIPIIGVAIYLLVGPMAR